MISARQSESSHRCPGRGGGRSGGRDAVAGAIPRDCRRDVARRQARRLHPRLEPLGARRRDRQGDAAHDGRREGLRLRHRQRRLDAAATAPIVSWSPDSKKIATFQQDQRGVGEMYLVGHAGRPSRRCRPGSIRCPATTVVTMIQRVVIDVGRRRGSCGCRCRPTSIARRSATTWRAAATGATCSGARTRSTARLRLDLARPQAASSCAWPTPRPARSATCSRRRSTTFFESGNGRVNWRYLPASNEVIWFSERDNWGQLYLYDLQTGR